MGFKWIAKYYVKPSLTIRTIKWNGSANVNIPVVAFLSITVHLNKKADRIKKIEFKQKDIYRWFFHTHFSVHAWKFPSSKTYWQSRSHVGTIWCHPCISRSRDDTNWMIQYRGNVIGNAIIQAPRFVTCNFSTWIPLVPLLRQIKEERDRKIDRTRAVARITGVLLMTTKCVQGSFDSFST